MAKRPKSSKKFKSFSELHGSRSDVFKHITPEQLGHDSQINPPTQGGSPLINPGQPGHPINPSALGQSPMYPMGTGDEET